MSAGSDAKVERPDGHATAELRRKINEGRCSGDPVPFDPEAIKRHGRRMLDAQNRG